MLEIFFILIILSFYWIFLIYVNGKAKNLVESIRKHPELDKVCGYPSNTYFFWEFIRLDYSFAIFLWKNKQMPKILEFDFKEYSLIRNLAIFIIWLEVLRGLFIILIFIFHQKNYSI
ncbi:Uncharacterised protein [Neisseria canis]|uniref:Uncharacterized protein n=2 Tax=Neisseria canis TaxID=493 RepID=A0A3S4NJ61_9NEIS|nr:Uncharacterised protein [Neisseria canis]